MLKQLCPKLLPLDLGRDNNTRPKRAVFHIGLAVWWVYHYGRSVSAIATRDVDHNEFDSRECDVSWDRSLY